MSCPERYPRYTTDFPGDTLPSIVPATAAAATAVTSNRVIRKLRVMRIPFVGLCSLRFKPLIFYGVISPAPQSCVAPPACCRGYGSGRNRLSHGEQPVAIDHKVILQGLRPNWQVCANWGQRVQRLHGEMRPAIELPAGFRLFRTERFFLAIANGSDSVALTPNLSNSLRTVSARLSPRPSCTPRSPVRRNDRKSVVCSWDE